MINKKFYTKIVLSLILFCYNPLFANDLEEMSGISEAAGNSAAAAASQLSNDTNAISSNISGITEALGNATTEVGAKLDVSISQAQSAMDFATDSIAAGDLTAAVQTMSLVESVADMALSSVPNPTALDMTGVSFEDFSQEEMAALSSIAGQMGVGKVMAVQKMAGQMAVAEQAGFDSKGMMGQLDAQGIGIGTAMGDLAQAGMVDMEAVAGSTSFSMDNFSPENFASMNVAEMGMSPAMMAGALDSLPVGSAAAALETLQENPGGLASGFGAMSGTMTGTIAASMADKGMGTEMMGAMGASMGVNGLADAANGMSGLAGMEAMGEAMASMGMETMNATLQTAFSSPSTGITDAMSGTVGMISSAIAGKGPKGKTAVQAGSAKGTVAAGMIDAAPEAVEMPEEISEAGMMMGAMVMAKPALAAGLPGAMAPPDTMTAVGSISGAGIGSGANTALAPGVDFSPNEMGNAMGEMAGIDPDAMGTLGMDKMAAQVGMTPGMVASIGAAGVAGLDVTSVMTANVAGLGSVGVQSLAAAAKAGEMSAAQMGDMMETGLVNQGTMAAMGSTGMKGFSEAMGMSGGNMDMAAMTGGMTGMGNLNMNAQMNPDMAAAMGVAGPQGATIGDVMGPGPGGPGVDGALGDVGQMEGGMNLGQVSAAMGAGIDPSAAMGSVAGAAMAANEAGAGLAGAAMGAAMSAQGAAAQAMGATAMGGAMGVG